MSTTTSSTGSQYIAAATEYIARKQGRSRPAGKCDNGSRWYPTDSEDAGVTATIRSPSRAWPWSYYKACFSLAHIASIFGVDAASLKPLVSRMEDFAY